MSTRAEARTAHVMSVIMYLGDLPDGDLVNEGDWASFSGVLLLVGCGF